MNNVNNTINQASSNSRIYKNIMEELVEQETTQQLKRLPKNLSRYVEPVDVITYALNRLPALYASTEKGKAYQQQTGQDRLHSEIKLAVRQAVAAVLRDPIRRCTPLASNSKLDDKIAQAALADLQGLLIKYNLLDEPELTWDNLSPVVKNAIKKVDSSHRYALYSLQKILEQYNLFNENKLTHRNLVTVVINALNNFYNSSQSVAESS